ncbi:hypothetical protein QE152_g39215 [Popillia japonica]|uniref:DDE Tnp4 domain-containing protein n=1 Tax=Popillia japonica TaxID=7064 RepID=A0AAW1HUL4_POPJA
MLESWAIFFFFGGGGGGGVGSRKIPTTTDWKIIENGFRKQWNFPGCCGAINGKHVVIKAPPESGSLYYNYKETNSIVLMAVVKLI